MERPSRQHHLGPDTCKLSVVQQVNSSRLLRGFRGLLLALSSLQPGSHIYPACTTHLLSASCLPGATLNPGQDAQLDSARPPTPPSRDSALKLPLDKGSPPKPVTTPLAAFSQCSANKELVSPAEAPIILSSPRTSKTDSYDLVWRPRPDSRAPILYYVVKHRKVLLFCLFLPCCSLAGWWPLSGSFILEAVKHLLVAHHGAWSSAEPH